MNEASNPTSERNSARRMGATDGVPGNTTDRETVVMKVTASRSPEGEFVDDAAEDVSDDEVDQALNATGRASKEPISAARLEKMTVEGS